MSYRTYFDNILKVCYIGIRAGRVNMRSFKIENRDYMVKINRPINIDNCTDAVDNNYVITTLLDRILELEVAKEKNAQKIAILAINKFKSKQLPKNRRIINEDFI